MADSSRIEWTEATWSVVTGCTRISDGCTRCYIDRTPPFRMHHRHFDSPQIGGTTGVQLHPERLTWPLRWRKPRRIFVNSLSDLFHEDVPDELIARIFGVMATCPHHEFQVLTKRHARMRSLLNSVDFTDLIVRWWRANDNLPKDAEWLGWPLPNVHVGVSAESQKWADIRIPALLETPAAVRWVSAEPLLGPLDLSRWTSPWNRAVIHSRNNPEHILGPYDNAGGISQIDCDLCDFTTERGGLDWVVDGGESGPGARPAHPDWFRMLRDQCQASGIAYFHKQHGAYTWQINGPYRSPDLYVNAETGEALPESEVPDTGTWTGVWRVGKKAAGRELDGTTWDEFPQSAELAGVASDASPAAGQAPTGPAVPGEGR